MPFENMMGPVPPQPFNFETGYVDGGLAPPEQLPPPDQYSGIDARTPAEIAADQRAAVEQAAALSGPQRPAGAFAPGAMRGALPYIPAEVPAGRIVGRASVPVPFPALPKGNAEQQSRLHRFISSVCDILWYQF